MRRRRLPAVVAPLACFAALASAAACQQAPATTEFGALVQRLSEEGGYFDTDNLISNEASYLHVVDELERRGIEGGAYIGVGPGQNFSYIAATRPELALMIDIRRDNLLQHLWFKALFEASPGRLDYLCLMTARRCGGGQSLGVEALLARVDAAERVPSPDSLFRRVAEAAAAFGVPLSEEDRATIRSIHERFATEGLDLRFNTHGRAPRAEYPTLRRLLLERDGGGERASYVADEPSYQFVRQLQMDDRVVPVVGDLAGEGAMPAIARELRRRGLTLSAYYTSNVEFYLFREGTFGRFMANLEALPQDDETVIIRSWFNRFRRLPETRPGYASTQLLDEANSLIRRWKQGEVRSYSALVEEGRAGLDPGPQAP